MRRFLTTALVCAIWCGPANATTSASPRGFAGIAFGSTVAQLRAAYPSISLNPDSDRDFQVYMVNELRGVQVKSPAAFDFYRGRLIGAQVLLTTSTAPFWLENSKSNYGPPDTCTYCETPDMASARWKWADGTSVLIDGGGMLNIYTAEGQQQHTAWTARGEEKGAPLATAPPPAVAAAPAALPTRLASRSTARHAATQPQPTWRRWYRGMRRRVKAWF